MTSSLFILARINLNLLHSLSNPPVIHVRRWQSVPCVELHLVLDCMHLKKIFKSIGWKFIVGLAPILLHYVHNTHFFPWLLLAKVEIFAAFKNQQKLWNGTFHQILQDDYRNVQMMLHNLSTTWEKHFVFVPFKLLIHFSLDLKRTSCRFSFHLASKW